MTKTATLNIAGALAGAIALAGAYSAPAGAADIKGMEACYGIALAGQNSCANAAGTHACAGLSKVNYDGGEYRVVKEGMCVKLKGSLTAFTGVNKALAV